MSTAEKKNTRLDGWKAIAEHCGVTVRLCKIWAEEHNLPVLVRVNSVFAWTHDLDGWLTEHTLAYPAFLERKRASAAA